MDGEVKKSLDLNVRVEVNRVTSTRRNKKETANASAPLSRTDFNGYVIQVEDTLPVLVIIIIIIIVEVVIVVVVVLVIVVVVVVVVVVVAAVV